MGVILSNNPAGSRVLRDGSEPWNMEPPLDIPTLKGLNRESGTLTRTLMQELDEELSPNEGRRERSSGTGLDWVSSSLGLNHAMVKPSGWISCLSMIGIAKSELVRIVAGTWTPGFCCLEA